MIRKKVKIPSPIDYLSLQSLFEGRQTKGKDERYCANSFSQGKVKSHLNTWFIFNSSSLILERWILCFPLLQLGSKLLSDEPIHSVFLVNDEETELLHLYSMTISYCSGVSYSTTVSKVKPKESLRTGNSITSWPYPILLFGKASTPYYREQDYLLLMMNLIGTTPYNSLIYTISILPELLLLTRNLIDLGRCWLMNWLSSTDSSYEWRLMFTLFPPLIALPDFRLSSAWVNSFTLIP